MAKGEGMAKLNEMQEQLVQFRKDQDARAATLEKKIAELTAIIAAREKAKADAAGDSIDDDIFGEDDADEDETEAAE